MNPVITALSLAGVFLIGVVLVRLLMRFGTAAADPGVVEEAARWIQKGAVILDVRSELETKGGMIPGAVNIPHDQLMSRAGELGKDRNRPVVIYCRSGGRASVAEGVLRSMGYKQILNAGGYDALRAALSPSASA